MYVVDRLGRLLLVLHVSHHDVPTSVADLSLGRLVPPGLVVDPQLAPGQHSANRGEQSETLSSIREAVFIKEQKVPVELEWDGEDESSIHIVAYFDNKPAGTARILKSGQIGRMSVLAEYRKQGIGTQLLKQAEAEARIMGLNRVFLHAQTYIQHFYEKEGYHPKGDIFMDAGIPHIEMTKSLV